MTSNDKIKHEKAQYDINREAAKISGLSSSKMINMNILQMNQIRIIQQATFTYPPLGKAFEKQIKTIDDQGEKQKKALEKG